MKRIALKRTPMKRGKGNPIPAKVRAAVAARSGEFCEVGGRGAFDDGRGFVTACMDFVRAPSPATDMHHLVKRPRLHEPWAIVHLCRSHHELCEGPYAKGRLVFWDFIRGRDGVLGPPKTGIRWQIEVRQSKWAPLDKVLASGVITL